MERYSTELFWAVGLLCGVVITAALVNRLSPTHRTRLRRLVTLYALTCIALAGWIGFREAGQDDWASGSFIGSEVLRAFLLVNLGATILFSIVLPLAGV